MGFDAVSLFSGCGGFCEGARLAGFNVRAAVELDRFAVETYRHNFPEVPLYAGDVHHFLDRSAEEWLPAAEEFSHVTEGSVDLVFGGPPCQGYSQIGTRVLTDPRNSLYGQYVRILEVLQPRVFLMENVPNMLLLGKGMFRDQALAAFAEAGYANSAVRVVAATDFGVPQLRKRAIFFGVRDGLNFRPDAGSWVDEVLAGEKRPESTVDEAIADLPEAVSPNYEPLPYPSTRRRPWILNEMRLDREGAYYSAKHKRKCAGSTVLHNHHTKEIQERRRALIGHLKPGMKADSLPISVWNGSRPEKWRRLHPDKPAYTLMAQMHRDLSEWVHPEYDRWITVREAARLQSFHDGFVFKSSEWQMLKQIGNAVPPLLGRAVANVARLALEEMTSGAPPGSIMAPRPDSELSLRLAI